MVTGYNLSKDVIEGLAKRAKESGRSASKELEVILVGVLGLSRAMGEVVGSEEILEKPVLSRGLVPGKIPELLSRPAEEVKKFLEGSKKESEVYPVVGVVEPVPTRPFRSFMKGMNPDLGEKKDMAKKMAKGVPVVKVASEVKLPLKPGTHPMDEVTKSAKKRPKDTGEKFELIKGFYRETFDSIGDAMAEVDVRGWKPDEYQLKPVK